MLKLDKQDPKAPQVTAAPIPRVYQVSPEAARTRNQRQVLQEFVNDSLPPLDDQLAHYMIQHEEAKKKNGQAHVSKEELKKLRGYIQNTKFYIFDRDARVSWQVLPTTEQPIHQKENSVSEFEIVEGPSLMTKLQLEMLAQVSSCLPSVSPIHIKDKILDQRNTQIIITGDVGLEENRKHGEFLAGCVFKEHPKEKDLPHSLQKNLGFVELIFFIVHPEYQKLKLGQVLMERLKQYIRDKNAHRNFITYKEIVVYADNNAIGFFKKQNYRAVPQGGN